MMIRTAFVLLIAVAVFANGQGLVSSSSTAAATNDEAVTTLPAVGDGAVATEPQATGAYVGDTISIGDHNDRAANDEGARNEHETVLLQTDRIGKTTNPAERELDELDHVQPSKARNLGASGARCSRDRRLMNDSVWYDMDVTISVRNQIECSHQEWLDVHDFIERRLDEINLWTRFKITGLSPHLCDDDSRQHSRHLNGRDSRRLFQRILVVKDRETGEETERIDEDDIRFQQYLEAPEYKEHRRLRLFIIIFHLYYRGSGRCLFCRRDDYDHNSRVRRLEASSISDSDRAGDALIGNGLTNVTGMAVSLRGTTKRAKEMNTAPTDLQTQVSEPGVLIDDDLFQQFLQDYERSQELLLASIDAELNGKVPAVNNTEEPVYDPAVDEAAVAEYNQINGNDDDDDDEKTNQHSRKLNLDPNDPENFIEHDRYYRSKGISPNQDGTFDEAVVRRKLNGCGGCFRLDFTTDQYGKEITTRKYIPQYEYWGSHGVRIKGSAGPGCYTPRGEVRIFDPQFRHNNGVADSDADLGSPNKKCPGGGKKPGVGSGGKPTRWGKPNPGANCNKESNMIIIQDRNEQVASDCQRGGKIHFVFRYPVYLNKIGLMDMDEKIFDIIKVVTDTGEEHVHFANGYGDNSIETIQFNLNDVKWVTVTFPNSGAIR